MLLYGAWSKRGMGDFPRGQKWNVGKKHVDDVDYNYSPIHYIKNYLLMVNLNNKTMEGEA
jgi:hypothetical protein